MRNDQPEHVYLRLRWSREALRTVIAENIRRRGMSVPVLAGLAGTSRSHPDYVLGSEKNPTADRLVKIAAALEVEPWTLLKPTKPTTPQ